MMQHSDFPGFDNLFDVHDPFATRPFRAKYEPYDFAFKLSRGEQTTSTPVQVTWASGSLIPGDIVWTHANNPLIVHERVIDILQANQVTGWTTYPAEVRSKNGQEYPGFFGLAITGRCARVNLSKSTVVLGEYPGGWVPHFLGHFFDPETWDGSEIFMEAPDSMGMTSTHLFITNRVRQVLTKAKIRNLRFERLTEICVNTSNFTAGLKHLLPPDYEARLTTAYNEAGVPRPDWI